MKRRLIFINSHPIQYFAPLYRQMSREKDFDLTVFFCSDEGTVEYFDEGFGTSVQWDIPLLEGFRYVFLKNHALRPALAKGFWGLLNFGIVSRLWRAPKSLVVVFGWNYAANLLAIVFGRLFGHRVCLRCDIPVSREVGYSKWKKWLRRLVFRWLLFPWVHCFLFVGKQNKAFYEKYGVRQRQLVFSPFAVDNERFSVYFQKNSDKRALRKSLGLPTDKKIVLFSGKYIPVKQPLQLLGAFSRSRRANEAALVFVGDGELRAEMEGFVQKNNLQNVFLTGFVNQSEISKYYAAADVFVMCSSLDAWGLSVNEAMNFNLPLLLSNGTCCADDLVEEGQNGFVYPHDDEARLAERLDFMLGLPEKKLAEMGERSGQIVGQYSYRQIIEGFKKIGA